MRAFDYQSPLQDAIRGMIREKRALGYQYDSSARTLYKFDQFCLEYDRRAAAMSKPLIDAWVKRKPNESLATLQNRAGVVRQLALYMVRLGNPAYVLPHHAIPRAPLYTPYIFSDQEITALFTQVDACRYCAEVPLRHRLMPVLFRLLYGCGLRISEALNLTCREVDLETGVLTILDGKFNKDRLVPLSSENQQRCRDYANAVHVLSDGNTYFFPASDGRAITIGNVYKNFRRFLWQARISHGGWGKGPRLHDLRHTHAVHCLRQWVRQGKDLAAYLPVLKTYLGHDSFRDTAHYLRLTAELYPEVTAIMEQAVGHVIPLPGGHIDETN